MPENLKHRRPTAADLTRYLEDPNFCPSCFEEGSLVREKILPTEDDEGVRNVSCGVCGYSFYEVSEHYEGGWELIDVEIDAPPPREKDKAKEEQMAALRQILGGVGQRQDDELDDPDRDDDDDDGGVDELVELRIPRWLIEMKMRVKGDRQQ